MERLLTARIETDVTSQSGCRVVPLMLPHVGLSIHLNCPPGFFADLSLDSGLGRFAHYSSIIQKFDVFEKIASGKDGKVALAILEPRTVVAYAACWYPSTSERWSKLGELMYEMGAIEVSRNFRHMGIAQTIINHIMEEEFFEHKIAYMNGFSWHWDLDGSHLTIDQYRNLMIQLLSKHGFKEYYTNEPNIALREENIFMARVGEGVSSDDRKRFRNLRFGIVDKK
ncbi:MAG: N-acetyltransferase [Desulfomonilaceae bacterium]|nr:N-acetyltransferase [Desulfomonilaceae bacterium]